MLYNFLFLLYLSWQLLFSNIGANHLLSRTERESPGDLPEKGPYTSFVTQNSIIISWHTASPDSSLIQYGLTAGYGSELKDAALKTAHSLAIAGLLPDTVYHYRVLFEGKTTEDYTFRTAVPFDTLFEFTALGDTRTQPDSHLLVINRMVELEPHFTLHTGDLVADGLDESLWSIYFATICSSAVCAQRIPFYYAVGNHENESPLYYDYFYLPHNNPDSIESYYSFDYGNSHFVSLDTGIPYGPSSPQYRWLRNDLSRAYDKTYIFVFMHDHPYCAGGHNSDLILREALSPVFELFKVDFVLSGHSHFYQRNGPVNGVTYVITAGGGAPLYAPAESSWTVYSERCHHLVYFMVYPDSLKYEMVRTDRSIGDSLTYYAQERSEVFFGDVNGDSIVTVADIVYLINYLFKSGPAPIGSLLIGDVNCDGNVSVSDIVYLISYLFKGGPSPLGC